MKVGDLVATRDARTGITEYKKVTRILRRQSTEDLVSVSIADKQTGKIVEVLRATPEHPFFTRKGMVAAGNSARKSTLRRRGRSAFCCRRGSRRK